MWKQILAQLAMSHKGTILSQTALTAKLCNTSDTYPYIRLFIDRIILIKVKHLGCSIHWSSIFGNLQHETKEV